MIKNVTLGQYFPGESIIHKLDPRIKLIAVLALIVLMFCIKTYWGFLAVAVLLAVSVVLSKVSFIFVLKGIKPLWFILVFMFILNIFFLEGETVLFEWKFIRITLEALDRSVILTIRLLLLVSSTTIMTLTTSPMEITDALERLLKPLKVIKFPVHEMALMMSIALRFIPTLVEETDRIIKAQTARGAEFDSGNLLKKAKGLVPLLVPLFVSAFKRADELALAMEARCYHGGEGRTKMKVLHLKASDFVTLGIIAVLIAFVAVGF